MSTQIIPHMEQSQNNQEETEMVSDEVNVVDSFDDMNLDEQLLRGIYSYGFEKPSIIQSKAILPFISGRDLIAQSQSGTGKTGAFTIGCLSRIELNNKTVQAIVLSPTRELAEQTMNVFNNINTNLGVKIALCIGGTSVDRDLDNLEDGAQIIIGTPGRIFDLILRNALSANTIKMLILDEADEMLSFGFKDQIYNIFTKLPIDIQVGLFSATLPTEVLELTKKFMQNPVKILVKKDQLTLEGIKQYYIDVEREDWKFDTLMDLYKTLTLAQTILYVNTRNKCEWLARKLQENGYPVVSMHGSMSSEERKQIMNAFRTGTSRILISTDLLARGIDVQQVSLVINYDLPNNIENYIHRIGRSGRYGRKGIGINFITSETASKLKALQDYYSTQIEPMPANIADLI